VRLASVLPSRVRTLAPEALAFGLIGAANTVLYLAIVNVVLTVGVVKANVLATIVTTTLSYLANRHWTYRSRPKRALRREYTMFFGFNLAGLVIQAGTVGVAKYGLGLSEDRHRLALNGATCAGIGMATLFRFWAYRTLVFRPHPVDHAAPTGAAEALAEVLETEHLDAELLAAEAEQLRAEQRRTREFEKLTAPLEAELDEDIEATSRTGPRPGE
jgi:putative flippase GtrA